MSPWLTKQDINRLEMYSNNLADYHLIVDLLPALARFYFLGLLGEIKFSAVQSVRILISMMKYCNNAEKDWCFCLKYFELSKTKSILIKK